MIFLRDKSLSNVNSVSTWAQEKFFSFHTHLNEQRACLCVCFCTEPDNKLNGTSVSVVDEAKLLGTVFYYRCTFRVLIK